MIPGFDRDDDDDTVGVADSERTQVLPTNEPAAEDTQVIPTDPGPRGRGPGRGRPGRPGIRKRR
jgi:hypothetical protein